MPACFPAALRYVMTRFGFTQEALAFESKVSESTIGRYRNGKVESFSEKNVVALCVAMHLPPWLSFVLIGVIKWLMLKNALILNIKFNTELKTDTKR